MASETTSDPVRDLVGRELERLLSDELPRGEIVVPDLTYFPDPREPRFVAVSLALKPRGARGGWEPASTGLGAGAEHRFVVDRRHLRVVSGPTAAALRARVADLQRTRGPALAMARRALAERCTAVADLTATLLERAGLPDAWLFAMTCGGAGAIQVSVELASGRVAVEAGDQTRSK